MTSRSRANVSGCWSYLVEIYDLMALESRRLWVRRKGIWRMLPDCILALDGERRFVDLLVPEEDGLHVLIVCFELAGQIASLFTL